MMTVYFSRTCTDIWGNSMEMKGYEQKRQETMSSASPRYTLVGIYPQQESTFCS